MERKKSERLWRERLKTRLVEQKLWSKFNKERLDLQLSTPCCRQTAWRKTEPNYNVYPWADHHATMKRMCSHLNKLPKAVVKNVELPNNITAVKSILWKQRTASRQKDNDKIQSDKIQAKIDKERAKEIMATKKQLAEEAEKKAQKEAEELELERERVLNTVPDVIVEDDGIFDPLNDARWVYSNMPRLFYTDKRGIERLNEEVLKEAPSNGAIGLAHHALQDKSAWYVKWGMKIMPKEDTNKVEEVEETEEELMEEHDPTFGTLEKYFRKIH